MKEKSLLLKIEDIPYNVRLVLEKDVQKQLISKLRETFKRKELARKLNVDESTIFHWKKEDCHMKLIHLTKLLKLLGIDLSKMQDEVIGVKGESSIIVLFKKNLPFEIPVELVAHLQGDGSVKKRDGMCNYTNEELSLIDSFIVSFQDVFNTKFNLYKTEDYTQVNLPAVIGKILVSKFGTFHSKEFLVPKIKDEQHMKRYLRAIFDDEGSVVEDRKRYRYISIRLLNENALECIRKFLYKLGINSHFYKYKCELRISRFENIMLFAKKVGFTHPLQKEKLKKLLNNYTNK